MPPSESRVLTIMLTDIRGFTDRTARSTRSDIIGLIEKHKELVLPVLQKRGGRLIKTIGDAFLVVFTSPTDAVLSGVDAQAALAAYNDSRPEQERIEIRIAINVGEVNLTDNDIYGEAVNITSRIEGVAEVGEVFFTEAVYLAMNKAEVPSAEVGYLQLKGVPEKVRVYRVRRERPIEGEEDVEPVLLEEKGAKAWAAPAAVPARGSHWPWVFLALVALGAAGEGAWLARRKAPPAPAAAQPAAAADEGSGDTAEHPCREELARFCADVPAQGGQRRDCLRGHRSELSPRCARVPWLLPLPEVPWSPRGVDSEGARRVNEECGDDIKTLCGDVAFGGGKVFNCLWSHWDKLSKPCKSTSAPLWRKAVGSG